jgi:hypothetical protein
MNKLYAAFTGAALLALAPSAFSETALEQLQRANSGQTTGKTFDNSNNPQPSDARPRGSSGNIQTPSGRAVDTSSSTYRSNSSSGTASGYSTGSSTGTATGTSTPRRGSEPTRK